MKFPDLKGINQALCSGNNSIDRTERIGHKGQRVKTVVGDPVQKNQLCLVAFLLKLKNCRSTKMHAGWIVEIPGLRP